MKVAKTENEHFVDWFTQWQPWHEMIKRSEPERWKAYQKKRDEVKTDIDPFLLADLTRNMLREQKQINHLRQVWHFK